MVNAAEEQIRQAEVIAGFTLEALSASSGAFQEEGHNLARLHKGQVGQRMEDRLKERTLLPGIHGHLQ